MCVNVCVRGSDTVCVIMCDSGQVSVWSKGYGMCGGEKSGEIV